MTTVRDCALITFPERQWAGGTWIDTNSVLHREFICRRIYYLYGIPPQLMRGSHAHKELEGLMIAVSGAFECILKDGENELRFVLDAPNKGLYIPRLIWREVTNFSHEAVCLVLASGRYIEEEMIFSYNDFLNIKGHE